MLPSGKSQHRVGFFQLFLDVKNTNWFPCLLFVITNTVELHVSYYSMFSVRTRKKPTWLHEH